MTSNPKGVTDPLIPNLWLPHKEEEVLQCREESTGTPCVAAGPQKNGCSISAQSSFVNDCDVSKTSDAKPPEDEIHVQLPVSDFPSEISSSPTTTSSSDQSNSVVNSVRHLISDADPTVRYHLENRLAALTIQKKHRNTSRILRGVRKPRRAGILSETRRVQFAAISEKQRRLSQPKVIENEICVNQQQGENKVETTIPGPGYSPAGCPEKGIIFSKGSCTEENGSNTVSKNKADSRRSNVQ